MQRSSTRRLHLSKASLCTIFSLVTLCLVPGARRVSRDDGERET